MMLNRDLLIMKDEAASNDLLIKDCDGNNFVDVASEVGWFL